MIWKANKKAWVTQEIFQEWFLHHFIHETKEYCIAKNIPFKILLLIDNVTGHAKNLDVLHPDVRVMFMPPNTTALIQPMDQGIIASFKAYYARRAVTQAVEYTQDSSKNLQDFWKDYNIYGAIKNITYAWDDVKHSNMKGVWKNLCPQFFNLEPEITEDPIASSNEILVECGHRLGLEITPDTVLICINEQNDNLDTIASEDTETHSMDDASDEETVDGSQKDFNAAELKKAFDLIKSGLRKIEQLDPNSERFIKANQVIEQGLEGYKEIYSNKIRNSSE